MSRLRAQRARGSNRVEFRMKARSELNERGEQGVQEPDGRESDSHDINRNGAGEILQDDPAHVARQPHRIHEA